MKKIPKSLQTVFKLLISLAFFSVLLSFVQKNELVAVVNKISWPFFVLSFIISLLMLTISCAKWKIILDLKDKPLSYWELLKIYLIGKFFSNILPSTVGGDVIRSYYAGNLIESQSYAAVSVVVERFTGSFFLFLLVAVAPLFRVELFSNPYLFIPACAGLCCAAITVWISTARNPFALPNKLAEGIFVALNRLTTRRDGTGPAGSVIFVENLYRRTIERLKKLKTELDIAVVAVKQNKQFLRRLIFLTVFFYVLTWIYVYTAFRAFHVDVDFFAVCALVPAIMLVANVPVTLLGNLGYYESIFVFYFLFVGVEGAESLAMGLLLRLNTLSMGGGGFITYLVYRQKHRLPLKNGDFTA